MQTSARTQRIFISPLNLIKLSLTIAARQLRLPPERYRYHPNNKHLIPHLSDGRREVKRLPSLTRVLKRSF